jgi:L-lactate dehydrogenase complex protein LldG
MSADVVAAFEDALAGLDVAVTRTDPAGLGEALAGAVEPPAVATPLSHLGDRAVRAAGVTVDPTTAELEAATTGVTAAAFAIAEYGSVVLQPTDAGEEAVSLFVDRHVAVVAASDVVPDMAEGVERLAAVGGGDGPGDAVVATGPSATADMGELVVGAHGPETVHVVVVADR